MCVPSARCRALATCINEDYQHSQSMEHENDMEETLVVDVDEVEVKVTTGSTDEALDDGEVEMVTALLIQWRGGTC